MTIEERIGDFLKAHPEVAEVELRVDRYGAREVAIFYGPCRAFMCAAGPVVGRESIAKVLEAAIEKYGDGNDASFRGIL